MNQRRAEAAKKPQAHSHLSCAGRDIGIQRHRIEVVERPCVRLEAPRLNRPGNAGSREDDERRHLEACFEQGARIECKDNDGCDTKRVQRSRVAS